MGTTVPAGGGGGVELTHREVMTVLAGLLLSLFLAALDGTIVSTALPTMAGELGGLDQLAWVLTAYLLTSTASTPLWGKLSDLKGRRWTFQVAIVWFLVASALTGAAQTMPQLIIGRGLQGIGGGGIMALTFVILGDLVSPRERGRYMGWFTGTFTSASLLGPLLGGFFVDNASWRWIFYLKIPFGVVALLVVGRVLRVATPRVRSRIDVEGAGLLVTAVVSLILVMVWGGDRMAWTSAPILGLSALFLVALAGFVWQERRAAEPIMPLRLFHNRVVALAFLASVGAGAAMMAAGSFLPLFLQVVAGSSATASGLALAPMMIMLTLGSIVAGNLMTRLGRYKVFIVVGPLLTAIGLFALTGMDRSTTAVSLLPWMVLMGLGMGLFMPTTTTLTQNALPVGDLGVGTATLTFLRNLGQTIGVGAYGAALAARIDSVLTEELPAGSTLEVAELLGTPERIRSLPPELQDVVIDAVGQGTTLVFALAVPVAMALVVIGLLIPELPLRTWSAQAARTEPGGPGTGPVASDHADR
jgi:EmrB/QacA subfamily drug resistance transporter